ncbi:MAG: PPC domain-containing protein [Acidobacteriota bacterium]
MSTATLAFVLLWLPAAADGQPAPTAFATGGEFTASQNGSGLLGRNAVGESADGSFVVVWQTSNNAGDVDTGIAARRFDTSSQPVGAEFIVNSDTEQGQYLPDITVAPGGEFIVSWNDVASSPKAQRFASDGSRVGGELMIASGFGGYGQVRHADPGDGSFVLVWTPSSSPVADSSPVLGRRFDSGGVAVGAVTQVNGGTAGIQRNADVAPLPSGEFLVSWMNLGAPAEEITSRRLSSAGAPLGADLQVSQSSTATQRDPSVATAPSGEAVIAWTDDDSRILARRLSNTGGPLGDAFEVYSGTISSSSPQVGTFLDGGFVVVWTDGDGPTPDESLGIVGRVFDRLGNGGPPFAVNVQTSSIQRFPNVVTDAQGGFRVVWDDNGQRIAGRSFVSATPLMTRQAVEGRTFSRSVGEHWVYYTFEVPAGAPLLDAQLVDLPSAFPDDADLYLKLSAPPTETDNDCSSTAAGNASERCTVASPTAGTWWIGVRGWSTGAVDFKVFADLPDPIFSDGFESGNTSAWTATIP